MKIHHSRTSAEFTTFFLKIRYNRMIGLSARTSGFPHREIFVSFSHC